MPSISEHNNCWVKVGEERYGPVTCELIVDAGSPSSQSKHEWGGSLTFEPGAKLMPLVTENEADLILDDGRQGHILIRLKRSTHGRRSSSGINFCVQGSLSRKRLDED